MYTATDLKSKNVKDLGRIADRLGVTGWKAMRKEKLVQAVVRKSRQSAAKIRTPMAKPAPGKSVLRAKPAASAAARKHAATKVAANKHTGPGPTAAGQARPKTAYALNKIKLAHEKRALRKDLSQAGATNGKAAKRRERIVLLVRDAFWLQAIWEFSSAGVERARAALAEQWHGAKPVLRVFQSDAGSTTRTAERLVREIEVHGGVSTWYIDVHDSPKCYRVDIGYVAATGKYYSLARSNLVTTPRPGSTSPVDRNWEDIASNCEKIYALSGGYQEEVDAELQGMFEERLGRRMGDPAGTKYGSGADRTLGRQRGFQFVVEAEMIIFGTTRPNSRVTLAGAPVRVLSDGSFAARLSMPDRRQVLPVVASSPDGVEQRTVVLAVERNTKVMEPMIKESNDW